MRMAVVVGEASAADNAVGRSVEDAVQQGRVIGGIRPDGGEETGCIDIPAVGIDQHMILRGLGRIGRVENIDFGDRSRCRPIERVISRV